MQNNKAFNNTKQYTDKTITKTQTGETGKDIETHKAFKTHKIQSNTTNLINI